MTKLVSITMILLFFVSLIAFSDESSDLLNQLTAQEKTLWEAIKNKNMDAFSAATAPDLLEIDPFGVVMNKQQLIEEFGKFSMNNYTLSNFQLFMLDDDAAVLSYTADSNVTMNEQTMDMKIVHTTTYVETGGKWIPKFHTETPVVPSPTTAKP